MNWNWIYTLPMAIFLTCNTAAMNENNKNPVADTKPEMPGAKLETATLGNGCFWCTEAIFQQVNGVKKVVSGYSGGLTPNPTYKQVCSGNTGHAECLEVEFDPALVSFSDLLKVFFETHDPTTLNRQGADVGTQYRSVIFYHSDVQKKTAEDYINQLNSSKVFNDPIVTQVVPFEKFYAAEDYHQNYYNLNKEQPYCQYVIRPKVEKFKKTHQ